MIRIDALWLSVEPRDMRAGAERLLARVVHVFGRAQAHHGYLFANARTSRVKLLVHDGFGVWCAARRLNTGHFLWPDLHEALRQYVHGWIGDEHRVESLNLRRVQRAGSPEGTRDGWICFVRHASLSLRLAAESHHRLAVVVCAVINKAVVGDRRLVAEAV